MTWRCAAAIRCASMTRRPTRPCYQKKAGTATPPAASGTLEGAIEAGAFDLALWGLMGSVVGELLRQIERATERQAALLIVSASGGAMQEGILSLMQMARLGLLHDIGVRPSSPSSRC